MNNCGKFLAMLACVIAALTVNATGSGPILAVYFSPHGGAQQAIVREIDGAREIIQVQAYSFTSAPIAAALVAAHRRGVQVETLLDKSNRTAQYSAATFLKHGGIPVLIDAKPAIAHSKIMIIDQATVITGSFNFTKAAEEANTENLLIIKDAPELVQKYLRNYACRRALSDSYREKNYE
ncbi:MAG: phospholipase D family protein [Verrucomicrobiales bacterium]|nr:phospholipase D family protein [Verrucomicrobiales bacterium]